MPLFVISRLEFLVTSRADVTPLLFTFPLVGTDIAFYFLKYSLIFGTLDDLAQPSGVDPMSNPCLGLTE